MPPADIPQRIRLAAQAWGLSELCPITTGYGSRWLGFARASSGDRVVLKWQLSETRRTERRALRHWGSLGISPRLLATVAPGVILLEDGGPSIDGLPHPHTHAEAVGRTLRHLHDAVPVLESDPLLPPGQLLAGAVGDLTRVSLELIEVALQACGRLDGMGLPLVTLHGDCHPGNTLLGPDGRARLIDPWGWQGPACLDLAMWATLCPQSPSALRGLLRGYGRVPEGLREALALTCARHLNLANQPGRPSEFRRGLRQMAAQLVAGAELV